MVGTYCTKLFVKMFFDSLAFKRKLKGVCHVDPCNEGYIDLSLVRQGTPVLYPYLE